MAIFLQQLPALLGVVIGALASYLAGSAAERTRWMRQQAVRWDERRALAYSDYGHAVKNLYMLCQRMASIRHPNASEAKLAPDPRQDLAELERLASERAATWESVLLLGSPNTVAAARIWHRLVWDMDAFARGLRADPAALESLRERIADARQQFYAAARRDLGVTSGELPPPEPYEPISDPTAYVRPSGP